VLLGLLEHAPRMVADGPRVRFRHGDLSATFVLRSALPPKYPLVGTLWYLRTRSPAPGSSSGWAGTSTLRFAADGRFEATSTCGSVRGQYRLSGSRAVLSQAVFAKAACASPDHAEDGAFLQALLADGELVLQHGDDSLGLASGPRSLTAAGEPVATSPAPEHPFARM